MAFLAFTAFAITMAVNKGWKRVMQNSLPISPIFCGWHFSSENVKFMYDASVLAQA